MADIPDRERGYSVESDTLIVHERYQDHAPRAMRTSALGVTNIVLQRGMEPVPCEVCFPPPKPVKAKGKRDPIDLDADGGQVTPPHLRNAFGLPPVETFTPKPSETVTVTSTED